MSMMCGLFIFFMMMLKWLNDMCCFLVGRLFNVWIMRLLIDFVWFLLMLMLSVCLSDMMGRLFLFISVLLLRWF